VRPSSYLCLQNESVFIERVGVVCALLFRFSKMNCNRFLSDNSDVTSPVSCILLVAQKLFLGIDRSDWICGSFPTVVTVNERIIEHIKNLV
jgi:hypothetical protein